MTRSPGRASALPGALVCLILGALWVMFGDHARGGPVRRGTGIARRVANVRRRSRQHAVLAARSDQRQQLQEPRGRLAVQDRQPGTAARVQPAIDAARGQRHPLHDRRHAGARWSPSNAGDRRDEVDVQPGRGQARRSGAAAALRAAACRYWTDGWEERRANHLRHAGLPDDRARRGDRTARAHLRQGRHRRSRSWTTTRRWISITGEIGLHAAPIIVNDVVVIGAAHLPGGAPRSRRNEKGYVRGYDARTGKRLWIFHTIPRARRVRQRHVAEGFVGLHRQHRQLGTDVRRRGTGPRLPRDRDADRRLLRRPSARRQPVRRQHRRAGRQDRQADLALPDDSPRHLGLGPALRADPRRHHGQRQADQGARAAEQAGVSLRVRSHERPAGVAHRGAAGRERRRARRVVLADAAVPDQAAGIRAPGRVDRRPDRLHAGAPRRSRQDCVELQDRADLHAAGGQQVAGSAGHAHVAARHRRRELAGRLVRSRDGHVLHLHEFVVQRTRV